jgi:hypothetical protein
MITLHEALDILSEQEGTTGNVSQESLIDIEAFQEFLDYATGKKPFKSIISSLAGEDEEEFGESTGKSLIWVVNNIKHIQQQLESKKKTVGDEQKESYRNALKLHQKTVKKALEVESILRKDGSSSLNSQLRLSDVKEPEDIPVGQKKKLREFVDYLEDEEFKKIYNKIVPTGEGETSTKARKEAVEKAFPVKYETSDGETYHGLVRPPSGIITWEDASFQEQSAGSKAGKKFSRDFPELGKKIPIDPDNATVYEKAKPVRDAVETGRLQFADDKQTKQKVQNIFSDHDVSVDDKGYAKGVNKALSRTSFWNDVKKLV